MKRKGCSVRLWQSIKIDKRLALGLKAFVLLYSLVAPFAWRDVAVDLMPVYAVGFVLGTLTLSADVTLGALVLIAVTITMVTIGRQTAAARSAAAAETALDAYPAYETRIMASPIIPSPGLREGFSPAPPSQTETTVSVFDETADGEQAPEATVGPDFLLQPDGEFVTEANLAAAQTNWVGQDDVFSPLGAESYSVQGRARDVPVVPMVW